MQGIFNAIRAITPFANAPSIKSSRGAPLISIFAALALTIGGLLLCRRLYDRLYALTNNRKSCVIPATVRIARKTNPGNVIILGRRGLRFQFDDPYSAVAVETCPVGTVALIMIGTRTLPLRLVTYGNGTNGFVFLASLPRDTCKALLRQSLTKPRVATDLGNLHSAMRALVR